MADNVAITAGAGTSIAADDIGSVFYQRVKSVVGADGVAVDPSAGAGVVGTGVPRTTLASDCNFGTPIKYVTVSFTTPTGALAAGDIAAATQVIAACTRADDQPAILHSVTLIDTDDQKANFRIVLFDANTSLGTEDSAPDIDDTEILTVQGMIDFVVADYIDLGGASFAHKSGLNIVVKPATGTDDIYAAAYIPATSTPTYASGVVTARLGFVS